MKFLFAKMNAVTWNGKGRQSAELKALIPAVVVGGGGLLVDLAVVACGCRL